MSRDRWAKHPDMSGVVTRDHLTTPGVDREPETWMTGTECCRACAAQEVWHLQQKLDEARAKLARVEAVHRRIPDQLHARDYCLNCDVKWPCKTARAMDGAP